MTRKQQTLEAKLDEVCGKFMHHPLADPMAKLAEVGAALTSVLQQHLELWNLPDAYKWEARCFTADPPDRWIITPNGLAMDNGSETIESGTIMVLAQHTESGKYANVACVELCALEWDGIPQKPCERCAGFQLAPGAVQNVCSLCMPMRMESAFVAFIGEVDVLHTGATWKTCPNGDEPGYSNDDTWMAVGTSAEVRAELIGRMRHLELYASQQAARDVVATAGLADAINAADEVFEREL